MARYSLLIGGQRVGTAAYAAVKNPSTGETVGEMPVATMADLVLRFLETDHVRGIHFSRHGL